MTESLLARRRIEAQFAKGIFDVLIDEVGRERAVEILSKAVIQLAKKAGEAFAKQTRAQLDDKTTDGSHEDPAGLLAYAEILGVWQQDEALTIDLKVKDSSRLDFDVTNCRYAEMYRELGMADLGRILSCQRDGAFCQGFNPALRLIRTQTIMEGAARCDFRYALPPHA
jgi:hypothetical protein